jgi:aspartyl-tRNA synthetase
MRHKTAQAIRSYMNSQEFLEIETPILIKNTPEGAREYVVPSRVYPGKFYVLPQSPQLFKQLSMIAGLDKYYQIARCFRDEDPRADRQPEFTQVDIEMSFIDEDDIYAVGEGVMKAVFKEVLGVELQTPFPRLTFDEAMEKYGSDKPDMRFDLPLVNVSAIAAKSDFKVFKDVIERGDVVKALNAKGCADFSRKDMDDLTAFVGKYGAKGMAWFKVKDGKLDSNITKYFNEGVQKELLAALKGEEGDLFLFGADNVDLVNESMGALRVEIARRKGLIEKGPKWAFRWVVDIPMFGKDDKGRIFSMNHPFTSPKESDLALLDTDPMKAKSKGYDLVLNGFELGGGSIRIHDQELQSRIFRILDISPEQAEKRFGFLLKALSYGAPPHGGMAFGLDRVVMLLAGTSNIREVIAFPKTAKATDLMTGSPSEIDPELMKELKIKIELEDLT